jgi:tRNA pseudouridine38-40 synthase
MSEAHGVRLVVAYDGTDFAGWQEQPEQRTVQGVLARAVATMAGAEVRVRGASRTDAGVHALGQVAAFDSPRFIDPHGWQRGLNSALPDDVSVKAAAACAPGYEPRFDAVDKLYRYLVQVGQSRDPLMRARAWYLHPGLYAEKRRGAHTAEEALDLFTMREAALRLVGTHDFAAFRGAGDDRENTTRTLSEVELVPRFGGDATLLAIEVRGTAFMKNMVRILAGTLVEVGRGRTTPEEIEALLAPGVGRTEAGPTAPAHGLTLVEIALGRGGADAS